MIRNGFQFFWTLLIVTAPGMSRMPLKAGVIWRSLHF
jgi:hypothetical protein